MKVNFNQETKSIIINDTTPGQAQLLNISFACNALVAILHFTGNGFNHSSVIDYFFVLLLVSSVGFIIYLNLYHTSKKAIPIDQIATLKSSNSFNRIIYEIVLKNGKSRRINFGDDFKSIEKLKLLLNEK